MHKFAEETQSKRADLAADNLLSFAEICHTEALQIPREDSNSLMEVDNEPSNFADEYENDSVQFYDQEHEEEQPDEKPRVYAFDLRLIFIFYCFLVSPKDLCSVIGT